MTSSEKHQLMLKNQIKSAGEWLIANSEQIVSDVKGITDFQIRINLRNGDSLPTIYVGQENAFWNYNDFADEIREYERYEELERQMHNDG